MAPLPEPRTHTEEYMKRIVALLSSLLAVAGCSVPTAPTRAADAARAETARAALDGATMNPAGKLAAN
jgi:hypothetical protein